MWETQTFSWVFYHLKQIKVILISQTYYLWWIYSTVYCEMFLPHLYISKKVSAFQRNTKIPFEEYQPSAVKRELVFYHFIPFLRHISFSGWKYIDVLQFSFSMNKLIYYNSLSWLIKMQIQKTGSDSENTPAYSMQISSAWWTEGHTIRWADG